MKPNQTSAYAYTQHQTTVKIIEEVCSRHVATLSQDRTRDPVDDVLHQLPPEALTQGATLYAVMPVDRLVELKSRAPQLRIILLQLDGSVIERLTNRPYDPKADYPAEVVRQALKAIEIKGGRIRYMTFSEMMYEIKRRHGKAAVFNDVMREGVKLAQSRLGIDVELAKTCNGGGCAEINPMGGKPGYRISFPGTAGRLTPEQIAEALLNGTARLYHVEVESEEVLC